MPTAMTRPKRGPDARRTHTERPGDARPAAQARSRRDLAAEPEAAPEARSAALARLEAVLFLAEEPLGLRRLTEVAGLKDASETKRLLAQLRELLQSAADGFRIEEIAGGYQFLTNPAIASWLGRLRKPGHIARLTPGQLETLAAIAYKQPLTRADIDAIRGVDCGEIIRVLMEKGLLRTLGRQDSLGRPQLYGTSKSFLQILGFKSLADLPRSDG